MTLFKEIRSVSKFSYIYSTNKDCIAILRLPIVQGGTFSFLAPTFAILSLPHNKCPEDFAKSGWSNATFNATEEFKTEQWQSRMQEVR